MKPPPLNAKTDVPKGIAWMCATMFLLVSMDAIAKHLSATYPVGEVVWARFFFHVVILVAILNTRLPGLLATRHFGHHFVRAVLMLAVSVFMVLGLRHVQMVTVNTIMLTAPIFVTALCVPLLREHVGLRRWVGVAFGFAGAMIVIRPGFGIMDPAALFALGAALCYALFQISTRHLSSTEQPMTLLAHSAILGAIATTLWLPFDWKTPDGEGWLLLVALGGLGALAHFCLICSLRQAPASAVVPFTYTNLIWSVSYGFLIFGDVPDVPTVAGATIIVASGLYIYHRERAAEGRAHPEG